MNMNEEYIAGIIFDFMILDEFQYCDVKFWSVGVKNLLSIYSGTLILEFSATAIRYLDNQRDMLSELFDGNIVNEIIQSEAIICSIL